MPTKAKEILSQLSMINSCYLTIDATQRWARN